jgi:hypothetical protein
MMETPGANLTPERLETLSILFSTKHSTFDSFIFWHLGQHGLGKLLGGFGNLDWIGLDLRWQYPPSSLPIFAWFWYAIGDDPSSADVDHYWFFF